MKENIKMMKYLCGLTIAFFILTYIVSVNMEYGYISVNSKWISNNFLFAILGGIFTGLGVTLLMEYRHYGLNKNNAKCICFTNILSLYAQLQFYYYNLRRAKDENMIITDSLIDVKLIDQNSQMIRNVDYVPIINDKLVSFINDFNTEYIRSINSLILDSSFLTQAILKDKIENEKSYGQKGNITCQSPNTKKVVDILMSKSFLLIEEVGCYAQKVAEFCDRKKDWENFKQMVAQYEESYKMTSLEAFVLKNKEV